MKEKLNRSVSQFTEDEEHQHNSDSTTETMINHEKCMICQIEKNDIIGHLVTIGDNPRVRELRKQNQGIKYWNNIRGCKHLIHY